MKRDSLPSSSTVLLFGASLEEENQYLKTGPEEENKYMKRRPKRKAVLEEVLPALFQYCSSFWASPEEENQYLKTGPEEENQYMKRRPKRTALLQEGLPAVFQYLFGVVRNIVNSNEK